MEHKLRELADRLPNCPLLIIQQGVEWSGNSTGGIIDLTLDDSMTFEEAAYLLLHEYAHIISKETGHNRKLYSFLLPLAKEHGIPYSIVLKMEQGQWWGNDLIY